MKLLTRTFSGSLPDGVVLECGSRTAFVTSLLISSCAAAFLPQILVAGVCEYVADKTQKQAAICLVRFSVATSLLCDNCCDLEV